MKICIVGCAGLPASYGGFETLAENLVLYCERHELAIDLSVFCSGRLSAGVVREFHGAQLMYVPLPANGVASIAYDAWSLLCAIRNRADVVLVLGVSGAVTLPLVRLLTRIRVVTNIDGIEWRRAKWGKLARNFLRASEWLAVRCSHVVVADNHAVADHVAKQYGAPCTVIAYGGEHSVEVVGRPFPLVLPDIYALALCRIEPENNVEMILEAFSRNAALALVFVGNWNASKFGREMRGRYQRHAHLVLADPEYDLGALKTLRQGATVYVHGHSAGGTNPSLVEMMHFGVPVIAFDCAFNRNTTQDQATYFNSVEALLAALNALPALLASDSGAHMRNLARKLYTWTQVGAQYFRVLAL